MTGEEEINLSIDIKRDIEKVLIENEIEYSKLKVYCNVGVSVFITIDNVMQIVRTRRCIRTLQDPNKPSWYIQVALTPDRQDRY